MDRIHAVMENPDYHSHVITFQDDKDEQAIFPSINFTCPGEIISWTFGADWNGSTDSFLELQVWRPSGGSESYHKVNSTNITIGRSLTGLYEYILPSPLTFEAEDALGYRRFKGQVKLKFENVQKGHRLYFTSTNDLNIMDSIISNNFMDGFRVLVAVKTGKIQIKMFFQTLNVIAIRPSRLWVWFYEFRENEAIVRIEFNWKFNSCSTQLPADHTENEVYL